MTGTRRANSEGTYYRRSPADGGGWRFRIEVNGQRVSGSGRTRTEAKQRAMERARLVGAQRPRGTVSELVAEWSAISPEALGLKPTTMDGYASLLRSRIVPIIGEVKLRDLTTAKIAACFPLDGEGSASTWRSAYAALVRLLDYAKGRGLVGVNLAREVDRPSRPASTRGSRNVGQDAAAALLAAATGDRLELAAWLGFGCGLRRGEMLALQWEDVDLVTGDLHVTAGLTRSRAGLVRGTTKTPRGERHVPVPPVVVAQLRAHRRRQAVEQLAAGDAWQQSGLVLTNEIGGAVEPRALSRRWRSWARAAGLPDTGTHVGRHYAASTLLASGAASVADVAAQLGHDPSVLLTTYATAVAAGQRAASDVLGASLSGPVSGPVAPRRG